MLKPIGLSPCPSTSSAHLRRARRSHAAGDPRRAWSDGEATVTELATPFPISGQAVGKHLRVLERAGLIDARRTAQLRPSRLRGWPLKDAAEWLERLPRVLGGLASIAWTQRLQTMAEREPGTVVTITRVFAAPRERVWREWTEPDPLRRLVRRRRVPTCRSRPSRWTCVRAAPGGRRCSRARPPRDPLEGRVPRGRRARAPRLHDHRPARRGPRTSSSPSSSPTSATGAPRRTSRAARPHAPGRKSRAREARLGDLLRPDRRAAQPSGRVISICPVRGWPWRTAPPREREACWTRRLGLESMRQLRELLVELNAAVSEEA